MLERSPWDFRIDDRDGDRFVVLAGEIDLVGAGKLRELLVEQLDRPDDGTVVAELSAVTFMDSAALGALIEALRHAQEIGRRFVVTGADGRALRIMQIAGVYELLTGTAVAD